MSQEKIEKSSILSPYGLTLNNEILGIGAYGIVYSAYSTNYDSEIAVKVIPKIQDAKEYLTRGFPNELKLMKELTHPNIISFLQVIETNFNIYLVTEIIRGLSLLQAIQSKKHLNEKTSVKIFYQLCNGIQYCHGKGIAHRDLKCENIMLDIRGYVKIFDFGLAINNLNSTNEVVKSKTFCGSYAYACPEIIQNQPYEPQMADIWSLGIILYAMLFGSLPFEDHSLKKLFKMMLAGPVMQPNIKITRQCEKTLTKILKPEKMRPNIKTLMLYPWLKNYVSTNFSTNLLLVHEAVANDKNPENSALKPKEQNIINSNLFATLA